MTTLSWHGDPALKQATIAEMQAHVDADRLVKGQYWENGKGCAVGCLIESGDHALFESKYGIPKELAELNDSIFEGLPNKQSQEWPVKFLAAIPDGMPIDELRLVWNRFAVWLLVDETHGVIRFDDSSAIPGVAELHSRKLRGEIVTKKEWDAAEFAAGDAARDAAGDAAEFAARVAAEFAARDAARDAAEFAARVAARDAAGFAARFAAGDAAVEQQAKKLIELLEQCDQPEGV